ncbi:MAG TPA: DUF2510 domain-containing protein [Acidimicrobiales bacterium]|nr:DUF2510 domain-containing protein [Acidimicrobiales bacterium]
MHDDLRSAALRRGLLWSLAGVPISVAGVGVGAGVVWGPAAGIGAAGLLAALLTAWLLAGAPGVPAAPMPGRGLVPGRPEVVNLAQGIALATGSPPASAWEVDHPEPNVAAIEQGDRPSLIVTTGALASLTRDQLEAVCAAQLAIAHDPGVRRLDRMLGAWRLARAASCVAGIPVFVLFPAAPAIGWVPLAVTLPAELAGWLVAGKVKWWARVAADGVCVATTRHPEPLVAALRILAVYNGESVPVGWVARVVGTGASAWAIPPGMPWTMTTSVNGRVTDQRTAEQVDDVNLLVRAGLVRRICVEGGERSLASRAAVVEAVRRAGRAAAAGGIAEVEGMLVGLDGVVGPAGAIAGWYPDPQQPGLLRWWDGSAWTDDRTASPG